MSTLRKTTDSVFFSYSNPWKPLSQYEASPSKTGKLCFGWEKSKAFGKDINILPSEECITQHKPFVRDFKILWEKLHLRKGISKGTLLAANDRGTAGHRETVVELMLIAMLPKNVKLWKEWKQGYSNRENCLKVKKKDYESCLRGQIWIREKQTSRF